MDLHKNARTTPRSRAEIVRRVLQAGDRPSQVARAMGICPRTVRKWVARYAAQLDVGLRERSCRPRRQPTTRYGGTTALAGDAGSPPQPRGSPPLRE